MRRIEVGQILKTNYDTGPYRVVSIDRNCTCEDPVDWDKHIVLPPHLHMRLKSIAADHNFGEDAWLNFYDEETLRSVRNDGKDRLILCENVEPVQSTLAL